MAKRGLLERLEDGIVIGDGSCVFTLEKRGYVAAGCWTPEAAVLYPDAGNSHALIGEASTWVRKYIVDIRDKTVKVIFLILVTLRFLCLNVP